MIGSEDAPADEKIISVNHALIGSLHARLMGSIIVTPEFLDLEPPRLARAVLEQIIAHADIVERDSAGHPIMHFEFVCPPWLMDKLAAYGATGEDMEPEPEDYDSNRLAMGLCR